MTADPQTTIPRRDTETTFIQLWRMASAEHQHNWLATMRQNVHLLQRKAGFRSLVPHLSLDGRSLVVYAQWATQEALDAGASDPKVHEVRQQLDRSGDADGTLYSVEAVALPSRGKPRELTVGVRDGVVFIRVWQCHPPEQQRSLLSAMRESGPQIAAQPGCGGVALHASGDGTRVTVYTKWANPPAFEQSSEAEEELHAPDMVTQFGDSHAALYRVEDVFLALNSRGTAEPR